MMTPEPMDFDEENSLERTSNPQGAHVQKRGRAVVKHEGKDLIVRVGSKSKISYIESSKLGDGGTSNVYKGTYKENDKVPPVTVAIKRISNTNYKIFRHELAIWKSLQSDPLTANVNIVRLLCNVSLDEGEERQKYHYFAMELASFDLRQKIKNCQQNNEPYNRAKFVGYLKDAATGLKFLHEQTPKVVHCDVKPDNILIFCGPGDKEVAKISDFGISKTLSNLQKTGTFTNTQGAAQYQPPELLCNITSQKNPGNTTAKKYLSIRGDIFSLGVTAFYTISCGSHPFNVRDNEFEIPYNIMNARPKSMDPPEYAANHLFGWMLERNHESRPYIQQVLRHPFFWSVKRSYKFLREVGMAFDKGADEISNLKNEIDQKFREHNPVFNWQETMGREVIDMFSSSYRKKYGSGESLSKFIEFIRDKTTHYQEIPDELLTAEYFGDEEGTFCIIKFTEFILQNFPDLLIFLFVTLATKNVPSLAKLKKDFKMKEFKRSPLFSKPAKTPGSRGVKPRENKKSMKAKTTGKGSMFKNGQQSRAMLVPRSSYSDEEYETED